VRILLDTNVIVSALIWGGQPLRLIELAADGTILLYTSQTLLEELADVLSRSHLATKLVNKGKAIEQVLSDYAELAVLVEPKSVPRVFPSDMDDDHVIAAALEAKVDAIVTGDGDLPTLGNYETVEIWTVAKAIEKIEAAAA
jgi:uncharacterized protein